MEYFKLILGLVLIAIFVWLLVKNSHRTSFMHALLRFDTLVGLTAGIYLVSTSAYTLLIH